jgi:type IV secretory pathway ATPase VirB11/archaellum biosynthesis ATPase
MNQIPPPADANGQTPIARALHDLNANADRKREPNFMEARQGQRMISQAALIERLVTAFHQEHDGTPTLREADTFAKRAQLILSTTEYVLAVESITISSADKAKLLQLLHSELFGYGGLDALFADPTITTIALHGSGGVSLRYGHGDLVDHAALFEDEAHMERILTRLLWDANAGWPDDLPYVETGLQIGGRPVSLSIVMPPISMQTAVDLRLHPSTPITLDSIITPNADGACTDEAAAFLRRLAAAPQGYVIAGDTESGKTTLLGALAALLPAVPTALVERAAELRVPPQVTRYTPRWLTPITTFGAQIEQALAAAPACLLLDEVRSDEPLMIAPLLTAPHAPRLIWAFRSSPDTKRLKAALSMLARRAAPQLGDDVVTALFERLPFVVTVRRYQGQMQVRGIGEWQGPYQEYVPLFERQGGALVCTGTPSGRLG